MLHLYAEDLEPLIEPETGHLQLNPKAESWAPRAIRDANGGSVDGAQPQPEEHILVEQDA